MNITSDFVKGYRDMDVPYTLLQNEEKAVGIAVLLPGLGYTTQAPLLHYTTGIYLNGHFDVLQINYQYTRQEYEDLTVDEMDEALKNDVRLVLHRILEDGRYPHIHLVAKSFGTIALCNELERDGFQGAKVIWLTPLVKEDEVFQSMLNSKQEGLCIIGDRDRHFDPDRFKDLERKPGLEVHVLKGLNHSLEHDFHVFDSISAHKEIMTIMKAFIEA